jgi:hypothetical protein
VAEDDRALMERLAALEAEVKAEDDKKRAVREAAEVKVKEQRAAKQAEQADLRARQAALVTRKKRPSGGAASSVEDLASLDTLALAKKASDVKQDLAVKGGKSWVTSGLASMLLGPLGWLYAGSFREAIPASLAWVLFALIAGKLPMLLLMPVLIVVLPLSGIAGAMYAVGYNKKGSRQRLWGKDKKQLPKGSE